MKSLTQSDQDADSDDAAMRPMPRQPTRLSVEQGVMVVTLTRYQGNTLAVKETGGGLRRGDDDTQHSSVKCWSTHSQWRRAAMMIMPTNEHT